MLIKRSFCFRQCQQSVTWAREGPIQVGLFLGATFVRERASGKNGGKEWKQTAASVVISKWKPFFLRQRESDKGTTQEGCNKKEKITNQMNVLLSVWLVWHDCAQHSSKFHSLILRLDVNVEMRLKALGHNAVEGVVWSLGLLWLWTAKYHLIRNVLRVNQC